jgi:hypothetical protein
MLQLLEAVEGKARGLKASEEDKARIEKLARALETSNPTKAPLKSSLLNGQWELLYTTSDSILGKSKPSFLQPSGPIYQVLDGPSLTARNQETAPLFNSVKASLKPESSSKVKVQFTVSAMRGSALTIFLHVPFCHPPIIKSLPSSIKARHACLLTVLQACRVQLPSASFPSPLAT